MKESTTFEQFEKGKKGASTKKVRGKPISARVEKAANGLITHVEHAPVAGAKDYDYSKLHVTKVHKTPEEAANHISKTFGGAQMMPANEPEDATQQEQMEGESGEQA